MIKMIVCDMDGTLLNSDLKISQENLDVIQEVREQGIRFCIATGRPEQLVKEYIEPLQMEDPMILYNGSVIGHPFQEERLYDLRLSDAEVRKIISYCELNDIIYMPYTKDKIISKPNFRVEFFEKRNQLLEERNRCIFEDIRDIDKIVSNHINKILLIEHDEEKYQKAKQYIPKISDFEIATSQTGFIDINPLGASKGRALQILANHYGYDLSEILVFGDQDNDVSMLEIAGTSVAMANASEAAKRAADHIAGSNNESGVAKWIRENILK